MKTTGLIEKTIISIFGGAIALSLPVSAAQPHILLLMTDQQRGDALGCMGNPVVITPNLDKLSQDGYTFVNAYSSVPSSTPARACLLTGMSPWNNGMLGYGKMAAQYKFEMPKMLKENGYYTFGIGKMHFEPQKALHGFNVTLLDESGRKGTPDFISDYRAWFQLNYPGGDPDETGIGWNEHRAGVYRLEEKLHPTVWTGQTAVELIRNYSSDQPLFLKVSFARPHSPYDPPQRYLDLYANADISEPVTGEWATSYSTLLSPEKADKNAPFGNFGPDYAVNSKRHYYASITFIDDQVGAIIAALKEKGLYDNTLIVFVSDHGDMMGDHYHWRKTYPFQGSAHIPFLVKLPEKMPRILPKGSRLDQPVELRDVLPSFLDASGAAVPKEMDGASVLSLIRGNTGNWRSYIDLEHASCYKKENYWMALTDGKMKYIWYPITGEEFLFDLKRDPEELVNYAADKKYKKQFDLWQKRMIDHLSVRGDGFVKDGKLVIRENTLLYSPNYPEKEVLTKVE